MLERTVSFSLKVASVVLLLSTGGQALAATGSVVANVNRVLMSGDDSWGGCMAALTVSPSTRLATCAYGWVTFSCSGDFSDPVRAYRMVDQAQLSLATGKRVHVWFEDDKKHNGYCFASRIDALR